MKKEMEQNKCVIIGSGPAGYTAAIYAGRAGIQTVLYEGMEPGGQLTTTTIVENYPGFENGVDANSLMASMKAQAARFGAEIRPGRIVEADLSERPYKLKDDTGKEIVAEALIIATGATAKYLGYTKIDELLDPCHQKGIYSDLEEGKVSDDEFRQYILKDSRPGSTPEDVDRCVGALLVGMPEYKAELLTELSGKYDLFFLSNNNGISMRFCHKIIEEAGFDWKTGIKQEFLSYRMKMLKPGQEIFRESIRRTGFKPEELLFIDDSPANVNAASNAGMRSVLYEYGTDLREVLDNSLKEEK